MVQIAVITAQVSPGKDSLATFSGLDAKVKGLVEEECLFVALRGECVELCVLTFFLGKQFSLAFFEYTLNDELILEFLICTTDADCGVFEDEFGVALW